MEHELSESLPAAKEGAMYCKSRTGHFWLTWYTEPTENNYLHSPFCSANTWESWIKYNERKFKSITKLKVKGKKSSMLD